jgi:hypothetical protein
MVVAVRGAPGGPGAAAFRNGTVDAARICRYKRRWSDGRVAEGTRLEIWRTRKGIEGSNPSRSATR